MNSDSRDFMERTVNFGNPWLVGSARFKGYVTFVEVGTAGKIFCEYGSSLYGNQKYYDLEEFAGINVIRRFAIGNYGNSADSLWELRKPLVSLAEGCAEAKGHIAHYVFDDMVMRELCSYMDSAVTPRSLAEVQALGPLGKRTVANISQITATGKYIYTIDNVVYSEYFPVKWAINHTTISEELDGEERTWILGPGTSSKHCENCSYSGSFRGVFLGYCANCAEEYGGERGAGFVDRGIWLDQEPATYLQGVDIETLGYNPAPEEKYNCCLSGGELPTGPDICDNQADMDPVNEGEVDEYIEKTAANSMHHRRSKRYPRRAYGLPGFRHREVCSVDQTSEMTPDLIRDKMEIFLAENGIEVTDNNYSFPIGPRPEWDHYRITKRPGWWFAWNAVLLNTDQLGEDCRLEIRLYVSNVHLEEHPAKMQLECNSVRGRSQAYWDMMRSLKSWMLGETESPLIAIPPPPVYEDVYDSDGELLPHPAPMY